MATHASVPALQESGRHAKFSEAIRRADITKDRVPK